MSFVCLILAITGFIVVIMYWGRARAGTSMLSEKNILAHWKYSPGEWQDYSEKDFRMERRDKWALYRLVMIITAVVVVGFWLFHRDSGTLMVGMFLGLGILLGSTVLLTTSYDHWQNNKYQGEVYITRDGAYIGRKLHLWKGWGATLDDVSYDEPNRLLLLTYSMPSRTGRDSATARILVPQGQEEKTREIVTELARAEDLSSADI